VPVVVGLHGCGQSPQGFAEGTGLNALAEEENFLAVYPSMNRTDEPLKCWRWWEDEHQHRGAGLPAELAGITRDVIQRNHVETDRVYVTGISAGGAMTNIVAAAYPDLFDGAAPHSGLQYDAADDRASAHVYLVTGAPDPQAKGQNAYQEMGSRAEAMPTIVFQGDEDRVVWPNNGNVTVRQWIETNDWATDDADDDNVDTQPEASGRVINDDGCDYTRTRYADETGRPLVDYVYVHGLGHARSGGDPAGPDATRMLWDFFESQAPN